MELMQLKNLSHLISTKDKTEKKKKDRKIECVVASPILGHIVKSSLAFNLFLAVFSSIISQVVVYLSLALIINLNGEWNRLHRPTH